MILWYDVIASCSLSGIDEHRPGRDVGRFFYSTRFAYHLRIVCMRSDKVSLLRIVRDETYVEIPSSIDPTRQGDPSEQNRGHGADVQFYKRKEKEIRWCEIQRKQGRAQAGRTSAQSLACPCLSSATRFPHSGCQAPGNSFHPRSGSRRRNF